MLISPELDALPMRTKLVFFFDLRPLFKASGRKALVFEMYQLPLTVVQCGLCFVVLAVNYFYRPMVKTIEVGTHGVAGPSVVSIIDPVGHSVFVMTGALASVILCWLTATMSSIKWSDWRIPAVMFIWSTLLSSTYATFIWLISRSLKFKTSFYCIDVILFIVFFVTWQIGLIRIEKVFAEALTLRYPSVRVQQQEEAPKQGITCSHHVNVIISNTIIPIGLLLGEKGSGAEGVHPHPHRSCRSRSSPPPSPPSLLSFLLDLLHLVYMFIFLPAFASCSPPFQFVLRVFGHSFK